MLSRYKAVFFDVGGTLLRVEPSVGEVYAAHARPFGFKGSGDELDHQFRKEWREVGGIESLGKKTGEVAEKKFWRNLVFQVFESSGGLNNFEHYFETVYEAFARKDHWHVFDDVANSGIFNKLKKSGVVLGVVSNWDSRLHAILQSTNLAGHFDFILASAEVGSVKPDETIFAEALKRSGVSPHEACHIGDEPRADVQGANNAGIDAILIDRKGRYENEDFTTVRSFLELL
ncbi:MAG: HAD-IA family hydrolase [Nitrospinaceae bacterium]|jgi:putative hydrolase of the HAD superfamily|nr:HAD-IA family hydrolase [Nitrospinaceae bacterium]